MAIMEFNGVSPKIADTAFVADSADLIGEVEVGEEASVWFGAVLRADLAPIIVGNRSNVQDGCLVHNIRQVPVIIEDDVTVGHGAILHSCTIQKDSLIGMGAVVLDHVVIGEGSVVAAGCVVAPGTVVPPHSLVMGVPGKVVKQVSEELQQSNRFQREEYCKEGAKYRQMQQKK